MYGSDHTFSGGNSFNHSLSANIYFEAVGRKDAQILDEKERKIGHTIRASIEKSKFGPQRKCEFKVDFSKGVIDTHEEIAALALDYDIVKKTSTVAHEYGERKWNGFGKFCEALKEDPELAKELENKIRNRKNEEKPVDDSSSTKTKKKVG
jgi:recombination protein RecA